ncbi:MAG: AraC family transcriptional regulator [Nitrospinota bacterium]|nr:AraC family transcriptional regulator [Nitrospinota bacterium]
MPSKQKIFGNAFGPRVPSDFRNQLFPFVIGKQYGPVPGAGVNMAVNVIDAGVAGTIFHLKINDPSDDMLHFNSTIFDPEGVSSAMVTLSGGGEARFDVANMGAPTVPGRVAFLSTMEDLMHATVAPKAPFDVLAFNCSGYFIQKMFDGERAPKMFQKFDKSTLTDWPASPALHRIAREVILHPYHGSVETLYLQGKIIEALAEIAAAGPDGRKTEARPRETIHDKVAEAEEILSANPENPPSPMDLAHRLGVSYSSLNRAFVKHRGMTAFQFGSAVSLDHARKTLEQTDLTVAEVAYRHGYANPGAFIAAYKRRFGLPPGRQKRNSGGSHEP